MVGLAMPFEPRLTWNSTIVGDPLAEQDALTRHELPAFREPPKIAESAPTRTQPWADDQVAASRTVV